MHLGDDSPANPALEFLPNYLSLTLLPRQHIILQFQYAANLLCVDCSNVQYYRMFLIDETNPLVERHVHNLSTYKTNVIQSVYLTQNFATTQTQYYLYRSHRSTAGINYDSDRCGSPTSVTQTIQIAETGSKSRVDMGQPLVSSTVFQNHDFLLVKIMNTLPLKTRKSTWKTATFFAPTLIPD